MILVLNKNGEDSISTIEKPVKRKFLILIGQSNNTYKLVSQNENLIYFYGYDLNFKDAFVDVNIEKGRFTIDHYGGFAHRWGRSTAFEYYPPIGNWFLFDDEYSIMDASNTEEPNKLISEQKINSDAYGKIQVDKFDLINSAINIQIQTDDIAAQFSHFIKQFKLLQLPLTFKIGYLETEGLPKLDLKALIHYFSKNTISHHKRIITECCLIQIIIMD